MRKTPLAVLIAGLMIIVAPPAWAATVDLQLILAADVSISVDNDEFRLQRDGYAAAITNPAVLEAIRRGPNHAIAVTFIEWSGAAAQQVVVDWMVIRDGEVAKVFADALRAAPRSFAGATAIGAGIDFAMKQFPRSGVDSPRRVIDVSGDGDNNSGDDHTNGTGDTSVTHQERSGRCGAGRQPRVGRLVRSLCL